jgi:serine phosphatase RsbU (regulator of sigma subunit)
MMPKMDGIEVCRQLRADPSLPFMPIIMVTAKADSKDVVAGLEAGGDEYLTKPVDHAALVARVKSMLRIKDLHDTVRDQAARLEEQSAQLRVQLETATKIQSLFWPRISELKAGGHIWAVSVPAAYVGGDLYDVIPLSDDSLLAYVADVSDKGVPAALIMAALSTKIRSEAQVQREVDKLLETANRSMYRLVSEEGFFATIALARYWPSSGKIQLALGGHLSPLWIAEGDIRNLPQIEGISLGVTPDVQYGIKEILLSPGESILFFTDGVVEAENEDNELFGNDRLVSYIRDAKGPPWGKGLLDFISDWRGNSSVNDDLTILEIWRD